VRGFGNGQQIQGATLMLYDRFDMYTLGPAHMLIFGLILVIPFWQLFSKAGYSGWWSLPMLVPIVNMLTLYVFAFSSWPTLKK